MVEVKGSGGGQEDDLLSQRPAKYAPLSCTVGNTAISRTFVRSVLSQDIDRQWTVTERHGRYRPLIDRANLLFRRSFSG